MANSGTYVVPEIRWYTKQLCAIACLLSIVGIVFVFSSSMVYAHETYGSAHYFVYRHVWHLGLGIILFFVSAVCPQLLLDRFAVWLHVFVTLFVAATLIPGIGVHINGASRWLAIAGMRFQPGEFLPITTFLYIAKFASHPRFKEQLISINGVLMTMLLAMGPLVLLLQPDFGSAVTLVASVWLVLWIFLLTWQHIAAVSAIAFPLLVGLIVYKPYRLRRVLIFLNPWQDPSGKGFQVVQSLIAIGAGGVWGLGIGHSKQKLFYLPMQYSDFIFAIIAEETGLIGVLLIIGLFLMFMYCGLKVGSLLRMVFSRIMVHGFIVFIGLRAIMHIMVVSAMVPTKGLGLPFISYGGSAIAALSIMMGLVVGAVRQNR